MAASNKNLLREILELFPISIVVSSAETGVILWVNSRNLEIAGATSPEQILGRNLLEFLEPAQHAIALRDIQAVARGESPDAVIYRLVRLDGGITNVRIASVPVSFEDQRAILSLVTDVTETERAIEAAAENERRYLQLLDASPDGIFVATDDRIVFANETLARALGVESRVLLGRSVYDLVDPDDHRTFRETRRRAILKQSPPAHELGLAWPDAGRVSGTARTTPLRWDGEAATQTVMRDVDSLAEG